MADIRELVMRLKVQLESGQIAQAKSEIDTLAQSFEAGAAKGTTAYGSVNTALGGVVSTSTAAKEQTVALADGADAAGTKGATGIGKLNTVLSSAGNFLSTLATGFVMFTIPNMLMDAFSKIGQYMKEAVAAALEEETAMAKLRGALSTVTTDYQDLADVVNAWSLNAAENSLNSQEAIIESFQRIVSIGVPVAQSYEAVQMAIDLAAARGKDLQSVTEAIAKAYEGNYTQLTRLVPEIKSAVKEGAGFNEIMDLLGKYSGAAATGMEGITGVMQTTKIANEELTEAVGQFQIAISMAFAPDMIATFNNIGLGDANTKILELKLKINEAEGGTKNWAKSAYDAMSAFMPLGGVNKLLQGQVQTLEEMRESLQKLQAEQEMLTRLQEAGFSTTQIESYMEAWSQGTVFARDRIEEAVREQEAYNDSVAMAQAEINKIGDTWDDAGMAAGSAGKSVEEIAAATEATSQASREWSQTMQDIRGVATSISEEQLKYAELTGGDVAGAQQSVLDSIQAQLEGQQAIVAELEAKKAAQGLSLEEEKKLQSATLEVWKLMNDQVGKQNEFTEATSSTVEEKKKQEEADKSVLAALESSLKVQEMGVQAAIDAAAADEEHLHTMQEMTLEQKGKMELDAQQNAAKISQIQAEGSIQMSLDAQQNAAKLAQIQSENAARLQQIALEAVAAERLTVLTSQREVYEMKVKAALDAQLMVMQELIANQASAIGSGYSGGYTIEDLKKMSIFDAAALATSGAEFDLQMGGEAAAAYIQSLKDYYRLTMLNKPDMPIEPLPLEPFPTPIVPTPIVPPGGYGNTIYQTNNITVSGAGNPSAVFDEINKRIQELTGSAVSGLRA